MKFKVGDKVRIRQWDDMEKEFGTDIDGDIDCFPVFSKAMRKLCGKKAKIKFISGTCVDLWDFEGCEGKDKGFFFSTDMIEPVEDDTEIVISKRGKEVRAVFKVNGKTVKESVAKCHPDDRFNFKTGAEIAFSRLFEKKKKRITMREKLKQDHPDFVTKNSMGGCIGCPANYGYSNMSFLICGPHNEETCRKCWNREYIPQEKKK